VVLRYIERGGREMDGEIATVRAKFRPGAVFHESASSIPYWFTCLLATLSVPWTVKHHIA
jgi:hypothetical protein